MTKTEKITPVSDFFWEKPRENAPVAVFDSGVGGIAVLREIRARLPREELLYFGDSAHAPYGEHSAEEVLALTEAHAEHLLGRAKALVIACNTATAVAARELRARYEGVPIIGMEPAVKQAIAPGTARRILVMATELTLRQKAFASLLSRYEKEHTVITLAAPELVRLVERGEENSPRMAVYLADLLAPYVADPPDAVVLGCTHFCFAKECISDIFSHRVPLYDGVAGTVAQLARRLKAAGLLSEAPCRGNVTLLSSDSRALPLYARLLFED